MPDPPEQPYVATPGLRLTVLLKTREHAHRISLASALLKAARTSHLAGATVLEGAEGYGRSGQIHRHHLFAEDTPLSVVIVDTREQVDRFITEHHDLLDDHVVVIDELEVVTFGARR